MERKEAEGNKEVLGQERGLGLYKVGREADSWKK